MTTPDQLDTWWPEEIPTETPPQAVKPLPGIDLAKLADPPTEPDWLVQDRIAAGWLVLLGAKPGAGKTWISYALTTALATGRPWLGHDVPRPRRVLYIDAENGEDLALERLRQLGATADDLGGRLHYTVESVTLPNHVDRLRATLDQHRPDIVVIDTLASIAPTAERDTEAAAEFYAAVWHMIRDRGASLVLLVHLRKSLQGAGRDDALDSFRGAGHLVGAAHRAWTLEPISPDKPVILLHDVKARRGHKQPTIRLEIVDTTDDNGDTQTRVDVLGTVTEVETGYDTFIGQILTYLDATVTGTAKTADLLLLPDAPSSRRTAGDYLTRAIAAGVLHKPKKGLYTRGGTRLPLTTDTGENT